MNYLSKPLPRSNGFTLIEVMIVVAIVAILAALAFPSYREQIAKSRRAEASAVLLESSQYMRRFYSANDTFTTTLPASLQQSPRENTVNPYYTVGVVLSANTTSFTVTAAPVSGRNMADDRCGSYYLNSTGGKFNALSGNSPGTITGCWR
jgi:type IV pilus assembly protein PilE